MIEPIQSYPRAKTRIDEDKLRKAYGIQEIYRMGFNESILGPSPKVVAAIQAAAAELGNYPPMGDESLRAALAEVHGRGLTPDHFVTGCSGYEVIELVARTYLRPGQTLIMCNPTFGIYAKVAALELAEVVDVPLTLPDFKPDVDAILAAITPQTGIVLLCNPNNPTGTMMPAADFDELVARLPEHVLLVADDVYSHFVTSPDYPDVLKHILADKNIIRIQTFSKAYGLAGLRLGFGIAPPRIADRIGGLHRGFHQNRLNLAAGIAALADQAHLQANVKAALDGKAFLYAELDRLDVAYIRSETNFMIVQLNRPADSLVEQLKSEGVLVKAQSLPGIDHGLRVSIGSQAGNQAFIAGLERWLAGS